VADMRRMADARGQMRRPVVFEGGAPVRIEDLGASVFTGVVAGKEPGIPLGMPLTLAGPVVARLRREPGGNLLVVADDEIGPAALTCAVTALRAAGIALDVLDYGPPDTPWSGALELLAVRPARRRETEGRLQELAALIEERLQLHDYQAPARVCVIAALHRARELDPNGTEASADLLEQILREGPDVGVHVIAWCDKPVSVSRRLSSSALREFSLRLLGPMSRDDSFTLIDSELAATIAPSQLVLDDHDRATTLRLRRFTLPTQEWVRHVAETTS
jgi:S-DNA-T family DNA segregation ATPase FtsK/SpoIIIE